MYEKTILNALKQIDSFKTPVVALTADAMEGKAKMYMDLGFNDYLSKPIDKKELERILNKCLNGKIDGVDNTIVSEDSNIHTVTPITDSQIEQLNKLMEQQKDSDFN